MKRSAIAVAILISVVAVACGGQQSGANSDTIADAGGGGAQSPGEAGNAPADAPEGGELTYAGTVPAPEFPPGLDWINVDTPLTIEALRGKAVLLDFWTYGCINCIHIIPTLERLEEKYPDELVIIGVHSAKFDNESSTENIRQIVQRYDLHHPVINDNEFVVWSTYGARGWPTLVLIDPRGNVYASDSGEIPFEALDSVIGGMVAEFDALGEIDRDPVELALENAGQAETPLLFPGKVLADTAGNRLFVADSNHHRIVIADLTTYEVLDVIGGGQRGYAEGAFEAATFDKPQGMALDGDTLYVADTNNHAIRSVDLAARSVSTLAGSGIQGTAFYPPGTVMSDLTAVDLRSPWDLELVDRTLYIAMAGTHQIWSLDLDAGEMQIAVGNGREGLVNAAPLDSELAQPSGLYYTNGMLYFADSESSSIRVADLERNNLRTVSGPGENNLFDFGDADGTIGTVLLQHPLGVVGAPDGLLYITDTYNSKIKVIDPDSLETTTFLGLGGGGGFADGGLNAAQFDEPGGLDYANGKLYVADTNNHAIRVVDVAAQKVSTVTFPNPEALRITDVMVVGGNPLQPEAEVLPQQIMGQGDGNVVIVLTLPDGMKINSLIDSTVELSVDDESVVALSATEAVITGTELAIPATFAAGETSLTANLTIYYCNEGDEGLCFIDTAVYEVPVLVDANDGGGAAILIEREILPPEL